jgi:hypothetical protein
MPRLLIIAYYFPPWGMGGVQRVAKFAKYLPEFGWDVTVIAPSATDYHNKDTSLLDELPPAVRVERIDTSSSSIGPVGPIRPLLKWLSSWRDFPDRHKSFAVLAAQRARELMRETPFDAVLTSSPPPSVHLAGMELRRDIPWIADFRDPWQALADDYGPTLFHRLKNSALHQRILKSADAVVAVTPELRKHFETDCGGSSVTAIRNGYDEADFAEVRSQTSTRPEFRVVIPGTFSRFSHPRPLLQGLAAYRRSPKARKLKVIHVGASMGIDTTRQIAKTGLADVFEDRGYVDHQTAIQTMLDADLLMLSYTDTRVTDVSVPGRIYEMLRAQRPIIAATPSPGALANLLAPLAGCELLDPRDVNGIAAAIDKHASAIGIVQSRPLAQIKQFERREETRHLSEICQRAISKRAGK